MGSGATGGGISGSVFPTSLLLAIPAAELHKVSRGCKIMEKLQAAVWSGAAPRS